MAILSRLGSLRLLCFALLTLSQGTVTTSARAQNGPLVANVELKLTLNDKVIDVIEKGDLLTVLAERENSFVIQTFNGKKGAVSKANAIELSEAVPIYDELIEANEEAGRLYTLRASAQLAAGNMDAALADYSQAIELGYEEAHAYSSRGLFYAAVGKFDEAIEDYTTAIEKDPKDELGFINRASVYMTKGEFEKAVADYTAAAELQPKNPVLYSQRAIAQKMLGNLEEALKDYDQTIQLAEKDVSAWMGRGFVRFQLSDHKAAIDDFSQAIELSPQSAVAFNNRGYNQQMLGEWKKAFEDYEAAVELAPRYMLALQNLAWLLTTGEDETLRDPDRAIDIATSICEQSEYKDPSDITLLAATYASASDFEEAIGWQEKAIELATEPQKPIAEKILDLYRDEKQLDPTLLTAPEEFEPEEEGTDNLENAEQTDTTEGVE